MFWSKVALPLLRLAFSKLVTVKSTSTLFPGRTKPATPTARSRVRMVKARMPLGISTAMPLPAPRSASWALCKGWSLRIGVSVALPTASATLVKAPGGTCCTGQSRVVSMASVSCTPRGQLAAATTTGIVSVFAAAGPWLFSNVTPKAAAPPNINARARIKTVRKVTSHLPQTSIRSGLLLLFLPGILDSGSLTS